MRRWILFKYLVQGVMAYGVEMGSWKEKEELEKLIIDYIRWMFSLDFCSPRYFIMKEFLMDSKYDKK